ncbi:hypothetical protein F5B21DRAFT_208466 [Xylaria acuta]|nr:hypothetical protein F5B21DRAFT_208466 [Xylaria acuta]
MGIVQQTFLADQTQSVPTSSQRPPQSITLTKAKKGESKAGRSFAAQPATALESRSSVIDALGPPRATKSAATKMSARVGYLDYPKRPVKHGQFPCPYCPIILTEEYTKKAHVAQDRCAYICVFEDYESSDEMFASTYEWAPHMAAFHSETELVCHKCTKHHTPVGRDALVFFQTPVLLQEHILASIPLWIPRSMAFSLTLASRVLGFTRPDALYVDPALSHLKKTKTTT